MDNIGWYIFQFFLSRKILVGISTEFVCLKMVGISTSFVCHEQQWLVYLPVLSAMNNTGWYISPGFVCHGQYWLVHLQVFSVVDNIGW